jgi:hypothetical protein
MRPLAFFDAAPYFRFSKFNSKYQHTVVSYTTWLRQSECACPPRMLCFAYISASGGV